MKNYLSLSFLGLAVATIFVPSVALAIGVNLFSDSFGSVDSLSVPGWIETGNNNNNKVETSVPLPVSSTIGYVYIGDGATVSTTSISTIGYQNIKLYYFWKGSDHSEATSTDALNVYWKKSADANYTLINTHPTQGSTAWSSEVSADLTLASDTTIDIKFEGSTRWGAAGASVDEVRVVGELIPVVIEDPVVCEEGTHEVEGACVKDDEEGPTVPTCTENQTLIDNVCVTNHTPHDTTTTTNTGGGGGGGGGGSSGGHRHSIGGGSSAGRGEVLGASTEDLSCEPYLKSYIKLGAKNDPEEVKKLQIFLNEYMGSNLPVSGLYGPMTYDWVKKFQDKSNEGVLVPWTKAGSPTNGPTGYVYKTTKRWINLIKCPELITTTPVPSLP